jgi:hypothetical protein
MTYFRPCGVRLSCEQVFVQNAGDEARMMGVGYCLLVDRIESSDFPASWMNILGQKPKTRKLPSLEWHLTVRRAPVTCSWLVHVSGECQSIGRCTGGIRHPVSSMQVAYPLTNISVPM